MRKNFGFIYRGALFLCCAVLVWSVWRASAQETNSQKDTTKVEVSASMTTTDGKSKDGDASPAEKKIVPTPQWVEKLAVNFPFLKTTLWGNELWKYIFSLILF